MAITFAPLTELTQFLTLIFSAIGVVIVSIGGFMAAGKLGYRTINRRPMDYDGIKREFTQLIVLGLDFFIAGDILSSFVAVVVGIRTVLSVFLAWEVRKPSKVDA